MNGRLLSVLIAAIVCLIGMPTLSRYDASASAAQPLWRDTAAVASPAKAAAPTRAETAATATAKAAPVRAASALMNLSATNETGISQDVLGLAVRAVSCGVESGAIRMPRTLTVIDYSLPSTDERLWVFEVATGRLLFKELVAHGLNTGDNMATAFSDRLNSRQSSIGLFVTDKTYVGSNGYSLRLDGLEPGFNGRARERAIVMHGAPYVNAALAQSQGRIGRSWGCPALRDAVARKVIDTIRGGDVIFSYYPDEKWLTTSKFLNCDAATTTDI